MKFNKTKLIAATIFGLVCVAIGVLFYLQFMTVNEEAQFNQVLADMKQLKLSLQANAPSANWQLKSSCDQAHGVYTKGDIGCTVGIAYQVAEPDSQTMQTVIKGFNSALAAQTATFSRLTHKVTNGALNAIATSETGATGDVYKHIKTGIQCSSYIGITRDKPHVFAILFQCTGKAQRMYFPSTAVG